MTGQAAGWDSTKVWREAASMAASIADYQRRPDASSKPRLFSNAPASTSTVHEPHLTDPPAQRPDRGRRSAPPTTGHSLVGANQCLRAKVRRCRSLAQASG